MKKKICIFCSLSSFNTGMPISTYKLAAELARRGNVSVCAILPEEGELLNRLRQAGVECVIIPFRRVRKNSIFRLRSFAGWLYAGFRLCKFIRKRGIDTVHFADIIDAPFYLWAKMAGTRVVAHVRVCVGGRMFRNLFRLWTKIFCSRIVTVSKFTKQYYGFGDIAEVIYNPGPDRAIFGVAVVDVPAHNISTAHDVSINNVTTHMGELHSSAASVIAVASFRRDKGHHNFLEIASRLKERHPGTNVKFIIVGGEVSGHEGYYSEIMADIKHRGLDRCMEVTGNVSQEQVAGIMSAASILLHVPDWEEALGGVILEAMASGCAVVAYNCGGVGECFTDSVSGFLTERGDVNATVHRIAVLLEDEIFRQKIAHNARIELDMKFTLEKYVDGVERIYNEI